MYNLDIQLAEFVKGGWRYISDAVMAVSCNLFMNTYLEVASEFGGAIPWSHMLFQLFVTCNYLLSSLSS